MSPVAAIGKGEFATFMVACALIVAVAVGARRAYATSSSPSIAIVVEEPSAKIAVPVRPLRSIRSRTNVFHGSQHPLVLTSRSRTNVLDSESTNRRS